MGYKIPDVGLAKQVMHAAYGMSFAKAYALCRDAGMDKLDADPELGLTPLELDGMPEGMEVYDNEMERWTKYGYEWEFYAGNLLRSSADLVEQYGPIRAK